MIINLVRGNIFGHQVINILGNIKIIKDMGMENYIGLTDLIIKVNGNKVFFLYKYKILFIFLFKYIILILNTYYEIIL